MEIKIFLFLYLFNKLLAKIKTDCEVSNYCGEEPYGCSVYGNCNYRLFDYYKNGSTGDDQLPHCTCFEGYSSYDIEVLKKGNGILCCYKKKGMLTAFFLELFLGFGIGHFYMGNYAFACIKLGIQIFLCVTMGCFTYFACSREHSFEMNYNEINNNENVNKNIVNEIKNNEIKNQNNEMIDENENENDEDDSNENKNNDSRNQSFELEDNKRSVTLFTNFVSCPKSILVISLSFTSFLLFQIVDICLIAFGIFKDENGEELYMWS